MGAMKVLAAVVSLGLLLASGLASKAREHGSQTWVPAVYHGLVVGKSTRADVLRVLGKPTWVGHESDTGTPMMDFQVSDPVPGNLSVLFRRGGILDGMALSPKQPLTEKDIVRILGSDFLVVRYAMDFCSEDDGVGTLYESRDGSVKHLEYRSRGLVVSFYHEEVQEITFVERLSVPKHSRCQGQGKKHPRQP
jgi:hypothetical protein